MRLIMYLRRKLHRNNILNLNVRVLTVNCHLTKLFVIESQTRQGKCELVSLVFIVETRRMALTRIGVLALLHLSSLFYSVHSSAITVCT